MEWLILFNVLFILFHIIAIGIAILSKYKNSASIVIFGCWGLLIELGTLMNVLIVTLAYGGDVQCRADNILFTFFTSIGIWMWPLIHTAVGMSQDLRVPDKEYRWRASIAISGGVVILVILNMAAGLFSAVDVQSTQFSNSTCTHVGGLATYRTYGIFTLNYQPTHFTAMAVIMSSVQMYSDRRLKIVFAVGWGIGLLLAIIINTSFSPSYVLYWSLPAALISLISACFSCCCARGVKSFSPKQAENQKVD